MYICMFTHLFSKKKRLFFKKKNEVSPEKTIGSIARNDDREYQKLIFFKRFIRKFNEYFNY